MTTTLLSFLDPEEPSCSLPLGQTKYFLSQISTPFASLSVNVRSLRKNFNGLLALLHTLDFPFSLIFLSETCLSTDEHHAFPIPGYKSISVPRNQHGGGNLLYYLDDLTVNLLPDLSGIFNSFESLFVSINCNSKNLTFGNVYRPPGKSIPEFNSEFPNKILCKLPNRNVVISGDFNINLLEPCNNNNLTFAMNLSEKNFCPRITEPTRVCSTVVSDTATLIDHVWDSTDFQSRSVVITDPVADHFPVFTVFNLPFLNPKLEVTKRMINIHRKKRFSDSFDIFLDNYFNRGSFSDPEFALTCLMSHLSQNIKNAFPTKTKSVKPISNKSPWITYELQSLIHKKHMIFRKCKQGLLPFSEFRSYRNLLLKVLRLAKRIFLRDKFNSVSKDQKATWKLINKCFNSNSNSNAPKELRTPNANITDDDAIANSFRDMFQSHMISSDSNSGDNPSMPPISERSIFFTPFTTSEIIIIISKLKKDSVHTSEFPVEIIQLIAPKISLFLTRAFNSCLEQGLFPNCLKYAFLSPRHKKGPKYLRENYRPIANLNIFSKIFEKLIYSRLMAFFSSTQVLSNFQFGFLPNKGIEKAALTLLHDLYEAKIQNLTSLAVFIDYSKAFDTIPHDILLEKLYHYGIRGHILDLIKSFLTPRTYQIRIRGALSSPITSSIGTPQGSSLSPLLFILFINDIVSKIKHSRVLLYADDLVIYNSNSNLTTLKTEIQYDLDEIARYSKSNKLALNSSKTKIMQFKSKPNTPIINIVLNSTPLESVEEFNYLGLTIDNKLTFKSHILKITKKLNSVNRVLYLLSFSLPFHILRKIFFSIGYPHVHLHIIAWGGANQSTLYPLKIALNKIIRNIKSHSPYFNSDTNQAYNELNILSIQKLYKFRLAEFTYSALHNNNYILQDFVHYHSLSHSYGTRQFNQFRIPVCKRTSDKSFFVFQAIKHWAELKNCLKDEPTLRRFKHAYRQVLLKEL